MTPAHYNKCQECTTITGCIYVKKGLHYQRLRKNIQGEAVGRQWSGPTGCAVGPQIVMGFAVHVLAQERDPVWFSSY